MIAARSLLRDAAALAVTAVYVLPILWWALASITPNDVLFESNLSFTPTWANFNLVVFNTEPSVFGARQSLIDSFAVALASTLITLVGALPAAFALSQLRFRSRSVLLRVILLQRFLPPLAMIFPLVLVYHLAGLIDSRMGLAVAHAGLNLPITTLLLKSFMDDIPAEVSEAATLDGATLAQRFTRVLLPLITSGIGAAALLAFIFSWTEFVLSLFLTQNMRLVPVQAQILVMNLWGPLAAFTTAAMIPTFVVAGVAQRHLVRGLTLGSVKG